MSVVVPLADLRAATDRQIGWCYLLTVSDKGQARVLAIAPEWNEDGTSLRADVGRGTAESASARPTVSMVWPPAQADGYTLIADGTVVVDGLTVTFSPAAAVLHRPAIATDAP
jgi:hypothetical protein